MGARFHWRRGGGSAWPGTAPRGGAGRPPSSRPQAWDLVCRSAPVPGVLTGACAPYSLACQAVAQSDYLHRGPGRAYSRWICRAILSDSLIGHNLRHCGVHRARRVTLKTRFNGYPFIVSIQNDRERSQPAGAFSAGRSSTRSTRDIAVVINLDFIEGNKISRPLVTKFIKIRLAINLALYKLTGTAFSAGGQEFDTIHP